MISNDHEGLAVLSECLRFEVRLTPIANAQIVKLEGPSWCVEVNSGMWSLLSAFARIIALSTSPQNAERGRELLLKSAPKHAFQSSASRNRGT